jgi:hypothetical protein
MNNIKKRLKSHDRHCAIHTSHEARPCSCGRDEALEELRRIEETLSASEALFGFAAWLTSLEKPVVFSARHEAGLAALMVEEFIKENGLEAPREGWPDRFKYPTTRDLYSPSKDTSPLSLTSVPNA